MNSYDDIPEHINEELAAFAKYNRSHIYGYFWDISEYNQKQFDILSERAKVEYVEGDEWQSEKYYQLRSDAQKSGYIAIVFAAMYIEAAVYNFGAIYLGDSYVKNHLDKLNITSKISVILRLITGKDLNSEGQAFEHLKKLFRYRNSLVHSKSKPLMSSEEMYKFQKKSSNDYHEAIATAKKIVKFLDEETKEINKDKNHPGIFGF